MLNQKLVVITPYYKAADKLVPLYERIRDSLEMVDIDWELIIVDDRSPDDGWETIKKLAENDKRVTGIRLSKNFGQHPAITAGMAHANGDFYVIMDCDLQDRPEDIPKLLNEIIETKNDIVIAERSSHALGKQRFVASEIFNRVFSWLSDLEFSSNMGNFRIVNNKVAKAFGLYKEQMRVFPVLISDAGFTVSKIELLRDKRSDTSSYTTIKLLNLALETFVTYSDKPLKISAGVGGLLSIFSGLLIIGYLIASLLGAFSVAGFTTLVLLVLFFGGTQILLVSTIGLYVGQVLRETKSRPIFIIDEILKG